jgi:hypothetical protein
MYAGERKKLFGGGEVLESQEWTKRLPHWDWCNSTRSDRSLWKLDTLFLACETGADIQEPRPFQLLLGAPHIVVLA